MKNEKPHQYDIEELIKTEKEKEGEEKARWLDEAQRAFLKWMEGLY